MKSTFGQVSLEYLVVLGFALFLLIPVVTIFQTTSVQSESATNANLLVLSGRSFISNAESVFYQGTNSRLRVEVFFPNNIENVSVINQGGAAGSELVFSANFDGVLSDFVFFSPVNLSFGNSSNPCDGGVAAPETFYRPGDKTFFIHSCGGNVSIYEFEG